MRRLPALAVAGLLSLAAACGNDSSSGSSSDASTSPSASSSTSSSASSSAAAFTGVRISGKVGTLPTVKVDAPVTVSKTASEVVQAGKGQKVKAGQVATLHFFLENATSGTKVADTYTANQPQTIALSKDTLFPSLVDALVGQTVGSRVALETTAGDLYGAGRASQVGLKDTDALVLVADILSVPADGPSGTTKKLPSGLPTPKTSGLDVTGLDFSTAPTKAPTRPRVVTLIAGKGPKTTAKSLTTFDYYGAVWGKTTAFDESYSKSPATFTLGEGKLIKAWDRYLVGVPVGSRVMIVAPPGLAYGKAGSPQGGIPKNATLVFVVDILGTTAASS